MEEFLKRPRSALSTIETPIQSTGPAHNVPRSSSAVSRTALPVRPFPGSHISASQVNVERRPTSNPDVTAHQDASDSGSHELLSLGIRQRGPGPETGEQGASTDSTLQGQQHAELLQTERVLCQDDESPEQMIRDSQQSDSQHIRMLEDQLRRKDEKIAQLRRRVSAANVQASNIEKSWAETQQELEESNQRAQDLTRRLRDVREQHQNELRNIHENCEREYLALLRDYRDLKEDAVREFNRLSLEHQDHLRRASETHTTLEHEVCYAQQKLRMQQQLLDQCRCQIQRPQTVDLSPILHHPSPQSPRRSMLLNSNSWRGPFDLHGDAGAGSERFTGLDNLPGPSSLPGLGQLPQSSSAPITDSTGWSPTAIALASGPSNGSTSHANGLSSVRANGSGMSNGSTIHADGPSSVRANGKGPSTRGTIHTVRPGSVRPNGNMVNGNGLSSINGSGRDSMVSVAGPSNTRTNANGARTGGTMHAPSPSNASVIHHADQARGPPSYNKPIGTGRPRGGRDPRTLIDPAFETYMRNQGRDPDRHHAQELFEMQKQEWDSAKNQPR